MRHAWRAERERPRASVVASIAVAVGIAGAVAGYHAAEQSCAGSTFECWDHVAFMPLGYTAGVALGGGIAGTAEGCRTALARATGGALLGLAAGVVSLPVLHYGALLVASAAPVFGATWLVTSCRLQRRDSSRGGPSAQG
jgi:hypothetical protein